MMGKSHVTVNVAMETAFVVSVSSYLDFVTTPVSGVCCDLLSVLWPEQLVVTFANGWYYNIFIYGFMALFLFLIGSVLPDIDRQTSVAGKVFYLPVKHRTWTHSIWFVIPLAIAAFAVSVMRFLLIGCLLHIWMDGFSTAGVCFFYPFQKYREYPNGAFVARHWHLKLYKANAPSEGRFAMVVVMICLVLIVLHWHGFIDFFRWVVY